MTKEERENTLHCLKVMIGEEVCEECNLYGTTGTDHCEADCVRTAIEALEQQPCEDAISRQARELLEFLNGVILDCISYRRLQKRPKGHWIPSHIPESILDECSECGFSCVTPMPKTGRWRPSIMGISECSECGYDNGLAKWSFCPICGARMIEPQESEDGE